MASRCGWKQGKSAGCRKSSARTRAPGPRGECGEQGAVKWIKSPEELKDLLEDAMKNIDCEKRTMFGYPSYFINKNMFMGLFQDKVFARLSDQHISSLRLKFPLITNLEPMPGMPMKDYYTLPRALYSDPVAFRDLIEESAEYTRSLQPKVKKPRKR
jgi:TfoX/Sxy family transcriptional regulator of competence genes